MVFGRKRNQEENPVENHTSNQNDELTLKHGDAAEVNDELSLTDSIPPPPPTGDIVETKNEEDSRTLEESPSTGPHEDANGYPIEKRETESIKRKKLMLIAACIVSFFILLGLAVSYGKSRRQSNNNAQSSAGFEDNSIESSIIDGGFVTSTASPAVSDTLDPTTDNVFEQGNTSPELSSTAVADEDTETAISNGVDPGTSVPSIDPSTSGSSFGFEECTTNEISVVTTCNDNGAAAASMAFCLVDEISDQFWEFVSTPPRIAPFIANDWGWMRDGPVRVLPFLPQGTYEVGLFANGEQNLNQYPLITSMEFVVNCGL